MVSVLVLHFTFDCTFIPALQVDGTGYQVYHGGPGRKRLHHRLSGRWAGHDRELAHSGLGPITSCLRGVAELPGRGLPLHRSEW